MLMVTNRRDKRLHVVGGSGIFSSIAGLFKRLFTSNAAKQIASTALTAGKEIAKDKAVEVGKRLVDKAVAKFLPPKSETISLPKSETISLPKSEPISFLKSETIGFPKSELISLPITQETKAVLSRLINDNRDNINNLMMGHGLNAIRIQDLVRRLNGGGLKVV